MFGHSGSILADTFITFFSNIRCIVKVSRDKMTSSVRKNLMVLQSTDMVLNSYWCNGWICFYMYTSKCPCMKAYHPISRHYNPDDGRATLLPVSYTKLYHMRCLDMWVEFYTQFYSSSAGACNLRKIALIIAVCTKITSWTLINKH